MCSRSCWLNSKVRSSSFFCLPLGCHFFYTIRLTLSSSSTIVLVSGLLGFWQEHSATNAVAKLLAIVQIKASVLRDGGPQEIPVEEIVPGDIVILNAGDIVPGDCLVD